MNWSTTRNLARNLTLSREPFTMLKLLTRPERARVSSITGGVVMPSDAEMIAYGKSLPAIYRDIFSAFPAVEPGRKAGYGLAVPTLAMHFANSKRAYAVGEIQDACQQLADSGFVEMKNGIFVHPSDLGEQLIAVLTGISRASRVSVPRLPAHTW